MDRFHPKNDKRSPMMEVVSFHGVVPLERGLCYCLYLVDKHYSFSSRDVLSASRDEDDIRAHNRQFGTNLHSQPFLILKHQQDPKHYAAANSVRMTSHCLNSDGNPAYRRNGRVIPSTGRLQWFQRGIDLLNADFAEWFIRHAALVDLHFVQPYKTGSELHHVVCAINPLAELARRSVINKR